MSTYGLTGTHHIELWVGNAKQAAHYYQTAWGFRVVGYSGLETGARDRVSYALQQDRVRLLVTSPLGADQDVHEFLRSHGDAVRDVAFLTDNASAAFESAVARGAKPVTPPRELRDDHGTVVTATIEAYGDVRHSLVQPNGYTGPFLPGFAPSRGWVETSPVGLKYIDHVVHNFPAGRMEEMVDWYARVFGFARFWSADDRDIRTDFSSLRSVVVANPDARVKMPINEPAPGLRKSQIEEYLDYNRGAGVQHVAIETGDILETVSKLRARGVEFLEVPDAYYDDLPRRVGRIDEPLTRLKELRILVDADEEGYLLQLFSKPVQDRPTLFFEVIQRKGSRSFGKGNFKALFESIEREQARRGNL